MSHIVTCRVCKEKFDTEELDESKWCMPSTNFYYHQECWDDWARKRKERDITLKETEEYWRDASYRYMKYILRTCDEKVFFPQYHQLRKKGYTPKGIYYSILYFYEILRGDKTKNKGGIGIVGYIYDDASKYWHEVNKKTANILEEVRRQIEERCKREELKIMRSKKSKKDKARFSLDEVGE